MDSWMDNRLKRLINEAVNFYGMKTTIKKEKYTTMNDSLRLAGLWTNLKTVQNKIDNEIVPVGGHLGIEDPELMIALEKLIFGSDLSRRVTQDSPVLPDVWIAYGSSSNERVDLLLNPFAEILEIDPRLASEINNLHLMDVPAMEIAECLEDGEAGDQLDCFAAVT